MRPRTERHFRTVQGCDLLRDCPLTMIDVTLDTSSSSVFSSKAASWPRTGARAPASPAPAGGGHSARRRTASVLCGPRRLESGTATHATARSIAPRSDRHPGIRKLAAQPGDEDLYGALSLTSRLCSVNALISTRLGTSREGRWIKRKNQHLEFARQQFQRLAMQEGASFVLPGSGAGAAEDHIDPTLSASESTALVTCSLAGPAWTQRFSRLLAREPTCTAIS